MLVTKKVFEDYQRSQKSVNAAAEKFDHILEGRIDKLENLIHSIPSVLEELQLTTHRSVDGVLDVMKLSAASLDALQKRVQNLAEYANCINEDLDYLFGNVKFKNEPPAPKTPKKKVTKKRVK